MLKQLVLTSLLVALSVLMFSPSSAHALLEGSKKAACRGVQLDGTDCPTDGGSGITSLIRTIINLLSVVVGIVAVIMVTIGGLKYITSGGDSANVSSAKNTIMYAIVGLIVVALAQVIVRFVLTKSTLPSCKAPLTTKSDGSCSL